MSYVALAIAFLGGVFVGAGILIAAELLIRGWTE
jgi:hypothetical protein